MELNFSNILYFISYISPVLVMSLVVLIGLLNKNAISSAIFTSMMLIIYFVGTQMQKSLNNVSSGPKHPVCSVFGENLYLTPSLSSMLLFASITYVVLPFIMSGKIVSYIPLISVLLSLWVVDFVIKFRSNCTSALGIVLGTISGGVIGGIFTVLLYNFLKSGLLFEDSYSSNNVTCNRPSRSQFKCSVYKNGKLIKEM